MNAKSLFWELAAELQAEDQRVVEGTIMNGRCLRVGKEFLGLVDYKDSGLVVKLPKERVAELIRAARIFRSRRRMCALWKRTGGRSRHKDDVVNGPDLMSNAETPKPRR